MSHDKTGHSKWSDELVKNSNVFDHVFWGVSTLVILVVKVSCTLLKISQLLL